MKLRNVAVVPLLMDHPAVAAHDQRSAGSHSIRQGCVEKGIELLREGFTQPNGRWW